MIGMDFVSFVTLLVLSTFASFVVHYLAKYRLNEGIDGFFGKVLVGWVGGWLGSPVFGHWPENMTLGSIYLVPALLGAGAAVFGVVLSLKTLTQIAARISVPSVGRQAESARRREEAA
jgi:uncharacterized membrane protein YeaQ/YmgE (transglycosylase-associated protein family)